MDDNTFLKFNITIDYFKNLGETIFKKKGEIFITPDDILNGIYVLLKGRIKYLLYSLDGREKIIFIGEPVCIIGDVPTYDRRPAGTFVTALMDLELVFIEYHTVIEAIDNNPDFSKYFITSICNKTRGLMAEMGEQCFQDAESKVLKIIIQFAKHYGDFEKEMIKINFPLSQQFIGNLASLNRVTTARVLKSLREEDIIDIENGKYILKRVSLLD
ncbi:cAMP-binding protein [Desulfosporosinus orientis DSM 765]|uniref:cAMP-binding protein n=1 Tax=Desulfosporosinus orientis (strain ATCC 19365 / DSM 765 / NCIMB 8382 / VKM B-1628 / Singapore I) TaxID=768706 RepID=G7W9F9_DESOD|nr:Crp/Fnr family transcriptional regulator [Desulfosporosinus orientis]AET69296.1 cAMP-binding protein [Desulfosporosinus orientis DSM 765]